MLVSVAQDGVDEVQNALTVALGQGAAVWTTWQHHAKICGMVDRKRLLRGLCDTDVFVGGKGNLVGSGPKELIASLYDEQLKLIKLLLVSHSPPSTLEHGGRVYALWERFGIDGYFVKYLAVSRMWPV